MAGGSFVGGSSPVAGGTVGFPVLVYVFDHPASLGRDFSLAIQSIGMVSAGIYILTRGRTIEWRILRFALLGVGRGDAAGDVLRRPERRRRLGQDPVLGRLCQLRALAPGATAGDRGQSKGPSRTRFAADPAIGFVVGALGGLLASVIGVGADILLYGILVLLYHTDIKIAIPTAVILMAFTSVVGAGCRRAGGDLVPASRASVIEVFPYWLAAAPVVAVGGPLGSLVSRFVPRRSLLGFVAVLCLAQYAGRVTTSTSSAGRWSWRRSACSR